jgi:hypothetical protein
MTDIKQEAAHNEPSTIDDGHMPTAINSQAEFTFIRMHLYVQLPTNFLQEKLQVYGK